MEPVAADETPIMPANPGVRLRLAGAQDHRHRTRRVGSEGVDGKKAARVAMGVKQRQPPAAVDHVERVFDVERGRLARDGMAHAAEVDRHTGEPDEIAQARCLLPAVLAASGGNPRWFCLERHRLLWDGSA